MNESCVFCRLVSEDSEDIIDRWEDVVVLSPLAPATVGHLLVVPTVHVRDFLELRPPLDNNVWARTLEISRLTAATLQPDGMNIITSAGQAATQTVFHLHLHVLPRYHGDAVGDFWPSVGVAADAQTHAVEQIKFRLKGDR